MLRYNENNLKVLIQIFEGI